LQRSASSEAAVSRRGKMNASGRRTDSDQTLRASPAPRDTTSSAGENSASAWRQNPHGGTGSGDPVTRTSRLNRRSPAATAAPSAARSAQSVTGYDAFSTLQPAQTPPDRAASAAPTRHPE